MIHLVLSGAKLQCTEGTSPTTLSVVPTHPTEGDDRPVATIMDHVPMVHIAPFGMCKTPANPQVAAATAAARGVLTPMPCVPVIAAPWSRGSAVVLLSEQKALTDDSTCKCAWTGSIEIVDAGTGKLETE